MTRWIAFALVTAFWVVMNALLWRSQSAAHSGLGSEIPVAVVWDKIVTAPDDSKLEIFDNGHKTGECTWIARAADANNSLDKRLAEDFAPDNTVTNAPGGYSLSVEGTTTLQETNHVRFGVQARMGADESLRELHLGAKLHGASCEIYASGATQRLTVKATGAEGTWKREFKFSELDNPAALLDGIAGADPGGLAGLAGIGMARSASTNALHFLNWEAHEDWMNIGHTRIQVYRLETPFFGGAARIFVSRAGEILLAESPNHVTLRNEAFSQL